MTPIARISSEGKIPISTNRSPKGIGKSPYSLTTTIRYAFNLISNGFFSYTRSSMMNLLTQHEVTLLSEEIPLNPSTLKIVFLGDLMVSKSGAPPTIGPKALKVLENADVVVANVEAPVVRFNGQSQKREGTSLSFKMDDTYLAAFCRCIPSERLWVISIANNHACDQGKDGIQETIQAIKSIMPKAQIIGAQNQDAAHSVLSVQLENGPKIGIIAWTDVMNSDGKHYEKPIVRGQDLSPALIQTLRKNHDYLIGFPHGNVEQSYNPEKKTRNRWIELMQPGGFDLIVGHGPHVLQPAEKVHGKPLFHSIGNFCSPRGPTQTKVGAIPEIDLLHLGENIHAVKHRIHLIEQENETVSISDLSNPKHPKIVQRIRKQWNSLFSSNSLKKTSFSPKFSFKDLKSRALRTLPFLSNPFY